MGFQREGEAVRGGKKENASRRGHSSADRKEVPLPTRVLYVVLAALASASLGQPVTVARAPRQVTPVGTVASGEG
jgi:hypothetical protein